MTERPDAPGFATFVFDGEIDHRLAPELDPHGFC